MRAKAARGVALLFGLSLLLGACEASSVREFLAELFPPPAESSGDEVAGEDAGDASEDSSEEGADEGSESGDASDNERCINRREHRGNLRSPGLRDERRNNNGNDDAGDQGDQQQEPEEDDASDEPSEQDEPEGAGDASEGDDGPAERQRPRRERPPADDNSEDEGSGGQSSGLSGIEQQVFDLLNAERERAGLSPLQLDSSLSQGARAWSRRMATEGFFEHDTSCNCAENIAYGYPTAAAVHDGWLNSEGHRANRMNSRYTRYGVGVYKQGNTLYYTERFE